MTPEIEVFKSLSHSGYLALFRNMARGEGPEIMFRGQTEAEARQKAEQFWAGIQPGADAEEAERLSQYKREPEQPRTDIAGSVWMIHAKNRDRQRVSPAQAVEMEKQGWSRGRKLPKRR